MLENKNLILPWQTNFKLWLMMAGSDPNRLATADRAVDIFDQKLYRLVGYNLSFEMKRQDR